MIESNKFVSNEEKATNNTLETTPELAALQEIKAPLDVFIIGAGPIGLACAIEAKKAGLSYLVVDKGCLVNSLYHYPVNMTFFSTSERLEIGGVPFMSLNPKPNRAEAVEYYRRVVEKFSLQPRLFEAVEKVCPLMPDVNGSGIQYEITTTKATFRARNVIVATGFYDLPVLMDVPGENLPKVSHYYTDPAFYAFQKLVVAGGNNSAVDAALECWRKGAEVIMVLKSQEIGHRVKYWARPDIVNRIAEGSIKAFYNSKIAAIRDTEVDIQTPGEMVTVANDFVLAMTGYQPNFSFLQLMGIHLTPDEKRHPIHNPDTMETNQPGIYLAGVVCGGMDTHVWFIENSREHAVKIIRNIARS